MASMTTFMILALISSGSATLNSTGPWRRSTPIADGARSTKEIPGAVINEPDPGGMRIKVSCANCNDHLGHVFMEEHFTETNARHFINSISMKFVEADSK